MQTRGSYLVACAIVANATGDHQTALDHSRAAFALAETLSARHSVIKYAYLQGMEAGLASGDREASGWFLSTVEGWSPGSVTPLIRAMTDRFRARLDPSSDETEGRFKRAAGLLRELGTPFYLACALLEHSEWLVANGRVDDAATLFTEAREIFERLEATPWVARADAIAPSHVGT